MAGSPMSHSIRAILELVGLNGSRGRPGPLNTKVVDFQAALSVPLHSEAMNCLDISGAILAEKALDEYLLRDKPHDSFSKWQLVLLKAKRLARQPQPDYHKSMELLHEIKEDGPEDLQIEA